jgi:pSer/pThr/pTyr-binding forkhead associated (FHA) protein
LARIVLESGGPPRSYTVGRSLIIGRHSGCGVVLDDPQSSRENTGIAFDGRAYILRDLDSRNGTYLNEMPVKGPQALHPNDRIRVGRSIFVFELDGDDAGLAPELRVPRLASSLPPSAPIDPGPGRPPARERAPLVIEGPGAARSFFYWLILLAILAGGVYAARTAFLWAFDRTIPK